MSSCFTHLDSLVLPVLAVSVYGLIRLAWVVLLGLTSFVLFVLLYNEILFSLRSFMIKNHVFFCVSIWHLLSISCLFATPGFIPLLYIIIYFRSTLADFSITFGILTMLIAGTFVLAASRTRNFLVDLIILANELASILFLTL